MTEEEKFWAEKEKQATKGFASQKAEEQVQKKYELLLDNQVDFIKSDLMKGSEPASKPAKASKTKKSDSDDSMEESDFEALEKQLTPIERERLNIKQQRESLPMFDYRDQLLAAIRDN